MLPQVLLPRRVPVAGGPEPHGQVGGAVQPVGRKVRRQFARHGGQEWEAAVRCPSLVYFRPCCGQQGRRKVRRGTDGKACLLLIHAAYTVQQGHRHLAPDPLLCFHHPLPLPSKPQRAEPGHRVAPPQVLRGHCNLALDPFLCFHNRSPSAAC